MTRAVGILARATAVPAGMARVTAVPVGMGKRSLAVWLRTLAMIGVIHQDVGSERYEGAPCPGHWRHIADPPRSYSRPSRRITVFYHGGYQIGLRSWRAMKVPDHTPARFAQRVLCGLRENKHCCWNFFGTIS